MAPLFPAEAGLSPRVRGNRDTGRARRPGRGSIPACAGEPRPPSRGSRPRRVYPRVCGGTALRRLPLPRHEGLSPRVRGNHRCGRILPRRRRSIPACAGEPRPLRTRRRDSRVYPRVCGGTAREYEDVQGFPGLSPRVRGNHALPAREDEGRGSIPACAGEPRPPPSARCGARVYPRVCGGTSVAEIRGVLGRGLSPRVRGNLPDLPGRVLAERSIPACAGEPYHRAARAIGLEVYPRVCGGTALARSRAGRGRGLSPRVRGNPAHHPAAEHRPGSIPACAGEPRVPIRAAAGLRSIPACAGEPARPSCAGASRRVYPRVCGGTPDPAQYVPRQAGLSPRVRGNQVQPSLSGRALGSIPACAGEPPPSCPRACPSRVYPRVCGGTYGPSGTAALHPGLSPRVRGNPRQPRQRDRRHRSIPACAGEPARRASRVRPPRPCPVYPRVCGGTARRQPAVSRLLGLSPRVRGNPSRSRPARRRSRSIPACAGEPARPTGCAPTSKVYPRVCGGTSSL